MNDHSELKRLAETATPDPWVAQHPNAGQRGSEVASGNGLNQVCADLGPSNALYIAAANPTVVIALVAEVEGLHAQHGRDSAELRSLCQARDDARKERDQLKAEVERLNEEYDKAWRHDLNDKNNLQVLAAEVVSLSKDAARFRFIEQDASSGMSNIYGDEWVSVIDSIINEDNNK